MTEPTNRRDALKCLGVGAGTLFTLQGGVFSAFDLADAQEDMGTPLFLQISDTHIGFNKGQSRCDRHLEPHHRPGERHAQTAGPGAAHRRCQPSLQGQRIRHRQSIAVAPEGERTACGAGRT